jgi:hypothetical protein
MQELEGAGIRLRIELKQALAAGTDAANDPGGFQHSKVLGDRLPGEPGARGELRD